MLDVLSPSEITEDLLKLVIRNDGSDYELIRHILNCVRKDADDHVVAVVKPRQYLMLSYWTNRFVRDPRALLRGGNALHVACSVGDVRTVRMLLESGKFDVTQRTRIGKASVLDIAKRFGIGSRLCNLLNDAVMDDDGVSDNKSARSFSCFFGF